MKKLITLALVAVLAACGSLSGYEEGWRTGRVEGVATQTSIVPLVRLDCRNVPSDRYIVVSFSYGGNPNLRANVIIPSDYGQRGEALRVNITKCPS